MTLIIFMPPSRWNGALYGLRFPVFPETEEVIPENETVIHAFPVIFTSVRQRRYLGAFGQRKGRWNGFWLVSQNFPCRNGNMRVLEEAGILTTADMHYLCSQKVNSN